jgi:branched-chain amino acid transport system substrate-binding protein
MAEHVRDVTAPGGKRFTFEELPEAVEALQAGEDIDYQGASGPIDMDEAGDTTAGVYDVWGFEGGGIETAGEVEISPGG